MIYPEFKYVSFPIYGITKKRIIVDLSLINYPYKLPNCYRSWCRFSSDIIQYQNAHKKSIGGYEGLCYSDFFPIDIDNKDNPEKSLQSCRELVLHLKHKYDVPIKAIRIYFSGSKGLHLEIPTILFGDIEPAVNIPGIYKNIAKSFGFDDIDTKIYFQNGLWRLPNSINSKSGLYKIPLLYMDLNTLTYEQLCNKAKIPNTSVIWASYNDWTEIDGLQQLWNNSIPTTPLKKVAQQKKPKLKQKLYFPGVIESKRNDTAFRISMQLKGQGCTLNEVKDYIVNEWNPTNNPPEKNTLSLKRTVESAYSYNHYDSGSIGITKHLRNDPYYNSFDPVQKTIYVHLLKTLNEVEKPAFDKYPVKANQRIFSYRKLPAEIGIGEQRVRTVIKKLIEWGRITVKTVKDEKGMDDCSLITFLCIDLTQYLTHQKDLSKTDIQQTQQLTTTNIINKGDNNEILIKGAVELNVSIKQIAEQYAKLEEKLSKLVNNKKWLTGVKEISNYLGDGCTKVSGLLKTGQLKSYRVGKKIKVRISDADSFIMFQKPFNKLTRPQKRHDF